MKKVFLILFGTIFSVVLAQQKKHTVVANENPTTIAKKYGVSVNELLKQNPKIKDGKINIGDVIIIPKKASVKKEETKKEEKKVTKKLGKISVQPKQTIYSITRKYKISEAELRSLNPNLESRMKIGEELVLPEENIKKYGSDENIVNRVSKKEEKTSEKLDSDTYVVQPKDTYYGITKKFDISQKELFSLNPNLEQKGLQPGDIIFIKGNKNSIADIASSTTTAKETKKERQKEVKTKTYSIEEYQTHKVVQGDTAFGIANKYNISYEQLEQLNEGLSEGIKPGMELRVKKYDRQYVKVDDDIFSIAMMLPFGFDSNDNKYRTMAADFLIGAKLAIERNVKSGKKINLNVIDAGSENTFKNNLSQINKTNTDIIIGPFFKSNILEVIDYVKTEKIPVVAPFAHSEDMYDYGNLIIVETGNRIYAERIIREVKNSHSGENIYIIGEDNDQEVVFIKEQLSKDLPRTEIIVTNSVSSIELVQNMVTGQKVPITLVLANNKTNIGGQFAKKVSELAKQIDGVKAFSMYYHPDFEKNIQGLSQASLVYLMDRKVNAEGEFEKEVLADFKREYCRFPSKYTVIGFDVVNDMLSREIKGDVIKNISKVQTHLATKFEYIRTKRNGAFVNTGFRVIRLVP